MRIPLDRDKPLQRQIERWLDCAIRSGNLPAGTRLPATRALAEELGVSRITVTNAYAALESDGLVEPREGSGTYVATSPVSPGGEPRLSGEAPWPLWQQALARSTQPASVPRGAYRSRGAVIAFTGVGDPNQFPLNDFARTVREVLKQDGTAALGYGSFDGGYGPLRETVAQILASQGIQTHPDRVLITSGSQQALALTCQVLLRPGAAVLVEKPTYNFALDLFRALELRVIGVPLDASGLQVDLVEPLLQQHHPRLIYTIPNFQNPSGACLNVARRRQLLTLADRYNVPILEDDFAGDLRFEGRALPAIKALDGHGQVIYVGTFSKMLMPGLRVGYLVADGPVFEGLLRRKQVLDLTTALLLQRVVERYVTVGRYQRHLRRSRNLYRARRDMVLAALSRHLPEAEVARPQGGLFVWVRLPAGLTADRLLPIALEQGVEFAPGTRFFADPEEGEPFVRLNFATLTPKVIDQGIRRLASAVRLAQERD